MLKATRTELTSATPEMMFVFAYTECSRDRATIAASRSQAQVQFCGGPPILVAAAARHRGPLCIVLHLHRASVEECLAAIQEITTQARDVIRIILRTDLDSATASAICRVNSLLPASSRVSIRGIDNLSLDIEAMERYDEPTAHHAIIAGLSISAPDSIRRVLVAATHLGAARVTVDRFAIACGVSRRTLEEHMCAHVGSSPREFLGTMLVLHSLWRLDVLNWPLKRCAGVATYRSPEALANFLSRRLQRRPRELRGANRFHLVLTTEAQRLASKREPR